MAKALLSIYAEHIEKRRGDIETAVDCLVTVFPDLKIAKGLNKLILDRCEFAHENDVDYSATRIDILGRAAEAFVTDNSGSPGMFRQRVLGENNSNTRSLYTDLPHNERLKKFKEFRPKELLERYNVALVQGLLLTANTITVRTKEKNAANLRRVFKFLKFFRLLARTYSDRDSGLRMEIDGPMSILDSARKYGMQLASFFPAACLLQDWQLICEVRTKKRVGKLTLDQTSGLVSHYRNLSAYVPEEVMMFATHFKKTVDGWSMTPNTPFINIGGAEFMFPDFTFLNSSGKQVYLELFHRWHRINLLPRIRFCVENIESPIILGIDRNLLTPQVETAIADSGLPSFRYFTFSDYPTVTKVKNCLDRIVL